MDAEKSYARGFIHIGSAGIHDDSIESMNQMEVDSIDCWELATTLYWELTTTLYWELATTYDLLYRTLLARFVGSTIFKSSRLLIWLKSILILPFCFKSWK